MMIWSKLVGLVRSWRKWCLVAVVSLIAGPVWACPPGSSPPQLPCLNYPTDPEKPDNSFFNYYGSTAVELDDWYNRQQQAYWAAEATQPGSGMWASPMALSPYMAPCPVSGGPTFYMHCISGVALPTTRTILTDYCLKWNFDPSMCFAVARVEDGWAHTDNAPADLQDVTNATPYGGSWGIMSIKSTSFPGTFPLDFLSLGFNVDFWAGRERSCVDGYQPNLSNPTFDSAAHANGYPSYSEAVANYKASPTAQNLNLLVWGCVGSWGSGAWYDGTVTVNSDGTVAAGHGGLWYIALVQYAMATAEWNSPGW